MARRSFSQLSAKFEKSWSKAVWITPSAAAAPLRETVEILERAAMHLGARGGERRGAGVGAGEAEDLVAGGDQVRERRRSR